MDPIDEIFALYESMGREAYRGERVSQLEHALQCAFLAESAGAEASSIVAALLHDFGHFVRDMSAEELIKGVNDHHDQVGADALSRLFPEAVTAPVRLHIEAKRFLCARDPDFEAQLSAGSRFSLKVQGGPHSAVEAEAFAALPFSAEAAQVRRWDDSAKIAGLETPDLEHFRPYLVQSLRG